MEHAPLRPVPARPAGPVDPATAVRELGAWLPTLPPLAAEALALVVLSERPRAEVAGSLGVSEEELAKLLATARKELRQTVITLGGSGWCERAEGLISDRLDGILAGRDTRRLDVHLRNCPRCVEHERRLVQATDALLAGVVPLAPRTGPALAPTELAPVPEDDVLDAPDSAPAPDLPASIAPPSPDQIAVAADVLVTARTRRQLATAVTWNAMIAIALILTVAAIAAIIAGILGAQL